MIRALKDNLQRYESNFGQVIEAQSPQSNEPVN
jgi:hypothetical protein